MASMAENENISLLKRSKRRRGGNEGEARHGSGLKSKRILSLIVTSSSVSARRHQQTNQAK